MSRSALISTGVGIWLPAALSIHSALTLPQAPLAKLGMLAFFVVASLLLGLLVWNTAEEGSDRGQVTVLHPNQTPGYSRPRSRAA